MSYPKEMLERMVANQKAAIVKRAKVLVDSMSPTEFFSKELIEQTLIEQECKCSVCQAELDRTQWMTLHLRGVVCNRCFRKRTG